MKREYALGTYLGMDDSPFSGYINGRAICSDGRVRNLKRIAFTADTFFSVPASVTVKGKTVAGYVLVETCEGWTTPSDDDPAVVKFRAYIYRKNHEILPTGDWNEPYITTEAGALAFLTRDSGRVPCSRYGWDSASCSPVVFAVATIVAEETGEPLTKESLDWIMGLVVNDHDDPETMIRDYGTLYGFPPSRYLN